MATASRSVIILFSLQAVGKEIELYVRVFVYGTLKRGHENHERFCRGVLSIEEAAVRGRIYALPIGYPALLVPEEDIQAIGTKDYLVDADTQARLDKAQPPGFIEPSNTWDTVFGELLTFDDPEKRLPAFDGLEGFDPDGPSLYRRVLVPDRVAENEKSTLAWVYVLDEPRGEYLSGGRWPGAC